MNHLEIREKFLEFFEKNGHTIVPSSSLVPDDPSVLFTTAGMQQFKPYYLGQKSPYGNRVASIQKSIRTVDIDEVGDQSHLTFFEMLGNFSFKYSEANPPVGGSYFKKEAIQLGYDFIIKELDVPLERIKISVFKGDPENNIPEDKESFEIWKGLGISEEKIIFGGKEDNFWGPTGNTGPCGPTTEIYIDGLEIWNIVFNEYYCKPAQEVQGKPKESEHKKRLTPLAQKGVDTGMGLERLAAILQKVPTIYETDLFQKPLGIILTQIGGVDIKSNRIVADHLRSSVFLLTDGFKPSNKEGGHVLRRLIRRLLVHSKKMFLPPHIINQLIENIINEYSPYYPELKINKDVILEEFNKEANLFRLTLDRGLKELYKKYPSMQAQKISPDRELKAFIVGQKISGKDAFDLYQTYGFPKEIIKELAEENLYSFDEEEFNREFKKHKEISRAGAEKKFGGHGLKVGDLTAADEEELKIKTKLHTATHLLHSALRKKFGPEVRQAGSDITAERLRFDFNFPRKLKRTELAEVEKIINNAIKKDYKVTWKEMPYEKAIEIGALAFFKHKYPPVIKVYIIGDGNEIFSREICGGPHVKNTGEIGGIKITREESISAGIRRIRAVLID